MTGKFEGAGTVLEALRKAFEAKSLQPPSIPAYEYAGKVPLGCATTYAQRRAAGQNHDEAVRGLRSRQKARPVGWS